MNNASINQFIQTSISLKNLELIVIDVPQKEAFTSAIGTRESRKALIIKWTNLNDVVGWGECSCRPDPFYSHEFVHGSVEIIKEFIFPLLIECNTYADVLNAMDKVRGWHFTKAAIEFAMNDVIRRETGTGIIESSEIAPLQMVPVGISMGLFESVSRLKEKIAEISDDNYQRLKFKISKGYNNPEILNYISELEYTNISFDANGSFTPVSFPLLDRFARMGHIIEQPFPPTDNYLHKEYLSSFTPFQVFLDEDIESYGNLLNLAGIMDEVNIKPGRVGGLYNSLRMIDFCDENNLDAWIGGMFETGIGRAQNLQLAALLHDAKAHDLSPSSRYYAKDIIDNPVTMKNGFIDKSYFSNIEVDENALYEMTIERQTFKN
jgi:O-succinylbenzoate synthase